MIQVYTVNRPPGHSPWEYRSENYIDGDWTLEQAMAWFTDQNIAEDIHRIDGSAIKHVMFTRIF